jgi:NAD(P)-dependent dehydrogenase (short-subunit alcohol dehydrogenase family)/uncharacterized OB-fold protein
MMAVPPCANEDLATPAHQPFLPPRPRSRAALGLTAAAALGRFELQVCRECGTVQYPPREACRRCLSTQLDWQLQTGGGELISTTTLFHSQNEYFRERLPWRLGMVHLDCGPTVITHMHAAVDVPPARVRVDVLLDKAGQAALIALPVSPVNRIFEDKVLQEMSCDPRSRRVLVTDGHSAVGQSLVRALVAAGARMVWVGGCSADNRTAELDALVRLEPVTLVPLDLTSSESVAKAGEQFGARVDIIINNAEYHRAHGVVSSRGAGAPQADMEINYFGLLRLAQEFGPAMRARTGEERGATAWVNLLSVYALANYPSHGTFSASKAAALSLSQCLRAQMQSFGIRVINVFPGPIDDERNRFVPPPKIGADVLAREIIKALQRGQEDVYPGDAAQEWLARWRANPKVLERELATAR